MNILKNTFISKTIETIVALIIAWISSKITIIIFPAIKTISNNILAEIVVGSIIFNIFLLFYIWIKRDKLQLKYGIYWDKNKNPFCPKCKIPLGAYDNYYMDDIGYLCKSCNKVYPLIGNMGKKIKYEQIEGEI